MKRNKLTHKQMAQIEVALRERSRVLREHNESEAATELDELYRRFALAHAVVLTEPA